jgi:Chorion family 3
MKKMLIAALILPVALLGAARPARAGSNTAVAVLAGVAVGVGAAVILDALIPRPVVAAPAVVYPPPPPPVVYQPAPVVVTPPPVVITPAPVVYRTPPPVVVHKTVIVKGPRRVVHKPHPVYVARNPYGYWSERYIPAR